jgi:Zn-dependent M28 family amino/carboxypeptidase
MKTRATFFLLAALALSISGLSGSLLRQPPGCSYNPDTAVLLSNTSAGAWMSWIASLSGAQPVTVGGQSVTLRTRYTPALFSGQPSAFDYVHEQLLAMGYPASQIEVEDYTFDGQTWRNLILTLPGSGPHARQSVILSAHLDSSVRAPDDPMLTAPGAEDNASGSAAVLEAARILHLYRFDRTLRLIWFTGEEEGLQGSQAFTESHDLSSVVGVINLDMFGYDSDNDRRFEIHAGTLPQSDAVGQCLLTSIKAYQLDLQPNYLTQGAITRSDHAPFWEQGVGAVEILESYCFNGEDSSTCIGYDRTPNYHTPADTLDKLNPRSGAEIMRMALAGAAGLAENLGFRAASTPRPWW